MKRYCGKCSARVSARARRCPACGNDVSFYQGQPPGTFPTARPKRRPG